MSGQFDDDDDDLMLNLNVGSDQFSSTSKIKSKKNKLVQRKKSKLNKTTKHAKKRLTQEQERTQSSKTGDRVSDKNEKQRTVTSDLHFPNKPFEIISSLFTKNPEIPKVQTTEHEDSKLIGLFAEDKEESTDLNGKLIKTLKDRLGFEQFTKVQELSIPVILQNKDVLIKSPTGSGKTLAYALPVIHKLQQIVPKINRIDGPYALVLLPTRELALQSYEVFESLCRTFVWIVPGLIVGGEKRKAEKSRIRKGINIIIATPGRLLDHLKATKSLTLQRVSFVIFDEADRLLDLGFEQTIISILAILKEQSKRQHQTVLLSATLNAKVSNLASISLNDQVVIDATKAEAESKNEIINQESDKIKENEDTYVTPDSLKQFFVIVPAKLRLVTLLAFLFKHSMKSSHGKLIVFFSSKSSTELHFSILQNESIKNGDNSDFSVYRLHGDMQQQMRNEVFTQFKKCKQGILLCTDVAARGLDLPQVNWIIQYSCPSQIDDYVHRVGRTARIGATGQAILFLLPSEVKYVEKLQEKSLRIKEKKLFDILTYLLPSDTKKKNQSVIQDTATDLQNKLEQILVESNELKILAEQAFKSFIQSYATYPSNLKDIFHVKKLHLGHIAKSFALRAAPQQMEKIGNLKELKEKKKEKAAKDRKRKHIDMSESGAGIMLKGPTPGGKKKQKRKK